MYVMIWLLCFNSSKSICLKLCSFGILPLEPSPGDPTYLQNYSHSGSGMEPPPPPGPPKKVSLFISSSLLLKYFHGNFVLKGL